MPIEDLVGVISLPVQIPAYGKGETLGATCGCAVLLCNIWPPSATVPCLISSVRIADGQIIEPKMSASFVPDHKASMVLFLDRVYGIDNQDFLLHVLEVGFLPDMRAAASLDTVTTKRRSKTENDVTYYSIHLQSVTQMFL